MKKLLLLALILFIPGVALAQPAPPPKTPVTPTVLVGGWNIKTLQLEGQRVELPPSMGISFFFKADQTFTIEVRTEQEKHQVGGKWSLSQDGKQLTIDLNGQPLSLGTWIESGQLALQLKLPDSPDLVMLGERAAPAAAPSPSPNPKPKPKPEPKPPAG